MAPSRRILEMQAARIEGVFAHHKVKSRVSGGVVTPRSVRFELTVPAGVRVGKLAGLADEIALALEKREARIFREGEIINVEVPQDEGAPVRLLPLCDKLGHVPTATAVLGVDEMGNPLLVRLPSLTVAHMLITGMTGAGKTALLRTLLTSLAMHNLQNQVQLILLQPRGRGLSALAALPHVLGDVAQGSEAVVETLRWLAAEMERRTRVRLSAPLLVVAIDELDALVQGEGSTAEVLLTRLLHQGREAGIHLIASAPESGTLRLSAALSGGFLCRLAGAGSAPELLASGARSNAALIAELEGHGDFVLSVGGVTLPFQAAWIGLEELKAVCARLSRGLHRSEPWSSRTEGSRTQATTLSLAEGDRGSRPARARAAQGPSSLLRFVREQLARF